MKEQNNNNISNKGQRIAKIIAASGYCSRRQAEELISHGRVKVNGKIIDSPALLITDQAIKIDNKLISAPQALKVWVFHKPKGYIVSNNDPQSRKTIFDILPDSLPRVITVGRLDINTEGLLILTNNGEAARYMELPQNKWIRNYRVRVYGKIDIEKLDRLKNGIKIDGIYYASIKVEIDREEEKSNSKANSWLKISLSEGKNREVKKVLEYCGLQVNRLIRISFGPFHLGNLKTGAVKQIPSNSLKEILGKKFNL